MLLFALAMIQKPGPGEDQGRPTCLIGFLRERIQIELIGNSGMSQKML
jgi:hypothetical protein